MWGFWDKAHWKPDAAIVNGDDFILNKAGEAYIRYYIILGIIGIISLYVLSFQSNYYTNIHSAAYFRLFHETFRTNEILDPIHNADVLTFKFRGFMGEYRVSALLEDGTQQTLTDNFVL